MLSTKSGLISEMIVLEWDVKFLKFFGVNMKFYCGTIPYKITVVSKSSF